MRSLALYFDKELLLTAEPDGMQDAEEMAYLISGGICRYRQGKYAEAEKDLRIAANSRYGTAEVKQMYQTCKEKVAAAKAAIEQK